MTSQRGVVRPLFSCVLCIVCVAGLSLSMLAACGRIGCNRGGNSGGNRGEDIAQARPAPGDPAMKSSVTYLHLLRKTPFFTALDTGQLRWTIDHSREWEAEAGTVIASCDSGDRGGNDAGAHEDAFWILLDGGWRLEVDGQVHPAGHADPGKWFSAVAARGPCRLVATEHSYVMRITRADMDDMLSRRFGFDQHLREGWAYYDAIFGRKTSAAAAG